MIQIYPMIPTERLQQATPPYGPFFLACVCAVLILAIIGGAALCATSLTEIKRHHLDAGRVTKGAVMFKQPPQAPLGVRSEA
ncbi:hypothetical protein PX860_10660 [Agrobacterium leguminum]|uniref:hypothetical protein n=1 Tax=Agrobacterium leguminum TaxID=2792015 RepID=UPI0027297D17|nr:hypothetical protein [Agrobacterium leguminum]WLD96028.1 hypothetical protein PX860_10660 [Agrobacterium leguminum]